MTGWLVTASDGDLVHALAEQMLEALSELEDPSRRSTYAVACAARAQRYSWQHTRGQLVSLTAAQFDRREG